MSTTLLPEVPTSVAFSSAGSAARTAAIVTSDEEIIRKVTALAAEFRKTAVERDQKRLLPEREIEQLSEAGFYGITVPRKYGGPAVSAVTLAEVFRILSAADPSIGQMPQNHFCWAPIFETGTPQQEEFFYRRLLRGERIGNAHSENTRRRPRDYETKIDRVSGGYVVTGKKYYSTGAIFAHWIPTIGNDPEGKAIMLFASRETPGLSFSNDWLGMGQRTTASGTTIFDRVFIPDEHVFPFHLAHERARRWGPISSLIHASVDLGIAEEAYADTREYVRTKSRPWIENPFDEHRKEPFIVKSFGELTVALDVARTMLRRGAESIDALLANTNPETHLAARLAVGEARIVAGQTAVKLADQLFELNGARSTLQDYGFDRHWRNARTHTLHDPVSWKVQHLGRWALNATLPPNHGQV
jgi:SfnB family sulfur acquisition oxidoreductase